jgi:hypothetical protein
MSDIHAVFNDLPDDVRLAVCRQVVAALRELPEPVRESLESLIRQIPVKGFKNPLHAGKQQLARKVSEVCREWVVLTLAVVGAWTGLEDGLRTVVVDYLRAHSENVPPPGDEETTRAWYGATAGLIEPEEGRRQHEARLMLAWVSRHEVDSWQDDGDDWDEDDVLERDEEESDARWVLDSLEDLDPGSPVWDDVEGLIRTIRDTAARKLQARAEADLRVALATSCGRLTMECADALAYLELTDLQSLAPEKVPGEACAGVVTAIETLIALVHEHEAARRDVPSSIRADRERRERLGRLEARIEEQATTLRAYLPAPPTPPCEGPPLPETDSPEGPEAPTKGVTAEPASETVTRDAEPTTDERSQAQESETADLPGARANATPLPIDVEPPLPVDTGPPPADAEPPPPAADEPKLQAPQPSPADAEHAASEPPPPPQREDRQSAPGQTLAWTLMADGDFAGVYWVARAAEAAGGEASPFPSWLASALQGALWTSSDADAWLWDLVEMAASHDLPADADLRRIALAAALPLCTVVPASGFVKWLTMPNGSAALNAIVDAVRSFSEHGYPLRSNDLQGVVSRAELEEAIGHEARAARSWLDERALAHTTSFGKARPVWQRLVQDVFEPLLRNVADDRRSEQAAIGRRAADLSSRERVVARIRDAQMKHFGRRMPDIVGEARNQLLTWTEEAVGIARQWNRDVERLEAAGGNEAWLFQQIGRLRDAVGASLDAACQAIDVARQAVSGCGAGSWTALHAGVRRLAHLLALPDMAGPGFEWGLTPANASSLSEALAHRLLLVPGIALPDDLSLTTSDVAPLASLPPLGTVSIDDVIRDWIARSDFRWTDVLLRFYGDDARRVAVHREVLSALDAATRHLHKELDDARADLELAVLEGVIDEVERARVSEGLEALAGSPNQNFGLRFAAVHELRASLDSAREHRLSIRRDEWRTVAPVLQHSGLEPARMTQVQALVDEAFASRDIRLVDELVDDIPNHLNAGEDLPSRWFEPAGELALERYLRLLPALEQTLRLPGGLSGARVPAELAGLLPGDASSDLPAVARIWQDLSTSGIRRDDAVRLVPQVLAFLNFGVMGGSVAIQKDHPDWVHLHVTMTDRGQSVVPEFGSDAKQRYNVVCVWERPRVDTVAGCLREVRPETPNVILIYLGVLGRQQRQVIGGHARRAGLTVAVLDEALLAFAGTAPKQERLAAFLQCALPFASINPYRPDIRGAVPREVFFGRSAALDELQSAEGTCIVFGGRRLGKTALLEEARRRFHRPEQDLYACVLFAARQE